jgi:hypothetical protein
MVRRNRGRGAIALMACVVAAMAFAVPASAKTYSVSGKQIVVDEDAGTFKMRGGLIGRWAITSFEELETSPIYHGRGTELFRGCLDRRHDRSCKRDPSGTLSFNFDYWALFASADPESLVWGSCWHPIVEGTGDFAGAHGVLTMVDTPTRHGVKTRYIGNVTLGSHHAQGALRTARRGC